MTEAEALAYILDHLDKPGEIAFALQSHAEWANGPRSMVTPDREVRTYRGKVVPTQDNGIPEHDRLAVDLGHQGKWSIQGLAMEAGASVEQIEGGRVGVIVTISYRADGG